MNSDSMYKIKIYVILILIYLGTTLAWEGDELEVFDVVEEVNQNFYTLLGVPREADGAAIKKAFRKLSLVLHPDKNDSPDADIQFRQLVSVYDVLKDPNKRKCYNNVLDNGLPDWKHAVYYYRRVRKMGLREVFVISFVFISIGQYMYGWASYFEKKLTLNEYLSAKTKKSQKKQKKGKPDATSDSALEEMESILVKPREESEEEVEVVQRAPRKRKTFVLPELKDDSTTKAKNTSTHAKPSAPPVITGGLWTDDDLLDLAKLVKKFPVGTTERWDKIGTAMNRPANEVAHMAHKLKDDILKNLAQKSVKDEDGISEEESEKLVVEEPKKVKTRGGKIGDVGENNTGIWSQVQQKALESALAKFSKGTTNDRWVKIAKCVPEKTKEECMLRYKYLVDMVKKKKEQDEAEVTCENIQDENSCSENKMKTELINENVSSIT